MSTKRKPSIGELRRKDEAIIKRMDPENPNVYYGLPISDTFGDGRPRHADDQVQAMESFDPMEEVYERRRILQSTLKPDGGVKSIPPNTFVNYTSAGVPELTRKEDRNKINIPRRISDDNPPTNTGKPFSELQGKGSEFYDAARKDLNLLGRPHPSESQRLLSKLIERGVPRTHAIGLVSRELKRKNDSGDSSQFEVDHLSYGDWPSSPSGGPLDDLTEEYQNDLLEEYNKIKKKK